MLIETDDYLTTEQATEALGCSPRGFDRALKRAQKETAATIYTTIFGKRVFHRSTLAVLRQYYYPYYSEAHQSMVKSWGAQGGATKAANRRARARRA